MAQLILKILTFNGFFISQPLNFRYFFFQSIDDFKKLGFLCQGLINSVSPFILYPFNLFWVFHVKRSYGEFVVNLTTVFQKYSVHLPDSSQDWVLALNMSKLVI